MAQPNNSFQDNYTRRQGIWPEQNAQSRLLDLLSAYPWPCPASRTPLIRSRPLPPFRPVSPSGSARVSGPLSPVTTSVPMPPCKLSAPFPPWISSSPAAPSIESLPLPPLNVSLPPPPSITSLPLPPLA